MSRRNKLPSPELPDPLLAGEGPCSRSGGPGPWWGSRSNLNTSTYVLQPLNHPAHKTHSLGFELLAGGPSELLSSKNSSTLGRKGGGRESYQLLSASWMRESRRAARRPGGRPGSSVDVILAEDEMFTALAGSPSEKPIAVIYGASDVYEAIPLPLTSLNRKHLQYVKVSERDEGVNRRVCRGQGDTSPSTSPCPAPAEPRQELLAAEQPVPLEDTAVLPAALPGASPSSSGAERSQHML